MGAVAIRRDVGGARGSYQQYKFVDAFAIFCFNKHHPVPANDLATRYPDREDTIGLLRWGADLRDAGSDDDAGHAACVNLLVYLSDVLEHGEPMTTHEGKSPATVDGMRLSEARRLQKGKNGEPDLWMCRPMDLGGSSMYRCSGRDESASRVSQRSASTGASN